MIAWSRGLEFTLVMLMSRLCMCLCVRVWVCSSFLCAWLVSTPCRVSIVLVCVCVCAPVCVCVHECCLWTSLCMYEWLRIIQCVFGTRGGARAHGPNHSHIARGGAEGGAEGRTGRGSLFVVACHLEHALISHPHAQLRIGKSCSKQGHSSRPFIDDRNLIWKLSIAA